MRRSLIVSPSLLILLLPLACRRESEPPPRYMDAGDKNLIPIRVLERVGDGSIKGSVSGGRETAGRESSEREALEEESKIDDSTAEAVVNSYVELVNTDQLQKLTEIVIPEQRELAEQLIKLAMTGKDLDRLLDEKFPGNEIQVYEKLIRLWVPGLTVASVEVNTDNENEANANLEFEKNSQIPTVPLKIKRIDDRWYVEDFIVKIAQSQGLPASVFSACSDALQELIAKVKDEEITDEAAAKKGIQDIFDKMQAGGSKAAEGGGGQEATGDNADDSKKSDDPEDSNETDDADKPEASNRPDNPGKPAAAVVDPSTLTSKIICGYQGWFACPGDGADVGWRHWVNSADDTNGPGPGRYNMDIWPDLSEFDRDELYPAPDAKLLDGSPGFAFSSANSKTVVRHFKWMAEYGIDGAFLQRFVCDLNEPVIFNALNIVLNNVRKAANAHGRVFAVEYDITSTSPSELYKTITDDWKYLVDKTGLTRDPRYLHHQGKPVVAIWGLGFHSRDFTPELATRIINFFKNDPTYGGNCCIGGVPGYWRTLGPDADKKPAWVEVFRSWDVIHPWTVGRYKTVENIKSFSKEVVIPDLEETKKKGIGYLPVVWPGFSWDNQKKLPHGQSLTPRQGGKFFWEQVYAFQDAGVDMMFVAMFDELDESTAIFKITDNHPVTDHFLTLEGRPSDWYLRLAGAAGRMLRREIPLTADIPIKPTDSNG